MKKSQRMKGQTITKKVVILLIVFLLCAASLLTGYILGINHSGNLQTSMQMGKSHVINLGSDANYPYLASQILVPTGYFVTNDVMTTSYDTTGGGGSPNLWLNKNYQILVSNADGHSLEFDEMKNDCILVYASMGFTSIDDWLGGYIGYSGDIPPATTLITDLSVGKRTAHLYTVTENSHKYYAAYLSVGDKQTTFYVFRTCNTNNRSDLTQVVQSIKFRGDVNVNP